MLVPLADAGDAARYGGKAAGLAAALAAGLPVPAGFAIAHDDADALAADPARAAAVLGDAIGALGAPVAVRSSAVGEDGAGASFAGQHQTRLGACDAALAARDLAAVHASVRAPSALAYRQRLGITGAPRMGVVVQRVIAADVSGVLFTCNPITGADERIIEAAWGLGEAVVQAVVTPDSYFVARGGRLLDEQIGDKDLEIVLADGETVERPVAPERARRRCLDDTQLAALEALATTCERAFAGPRDLEWAFAAGQLWLLQCRAITACR